MFLVDQVSITINVVKVLVLHIHVVHVPVYGYNWSDLIDLIKLAIIISSVV